MKEYLKPFIEDENIEIEDICSASTENIGNGPINDTLNDDTEDGSSWSW